MNTCHIARIIKADEFENLAITQEDAGVKRISGRLKKTNGVVAHAYEFDSTLFTEESVKAWLEEHGIHPVEILIPLTENEIKAGARHSQQDMNLIKMAHMKAKEIVSHMRELASAHKSEELSEDADDENELLAWEKELESCSTAQGV